MTRVRARRRPRRSSVDFSRLGWLVATEAAFSVARSTDRAPHILYAPRWWPGWSPQLLGALRTWARSYLTHEEVIV